MRMDWLQLLRTVQVLCKLSDTFALNAPNPLLEVGDHKLHKQAKNPS